MNNMGLECRNTDESQAKLARLTIEYLNKYSHFYKKLFKTKNIDISKFNHIEDIEIFPITTKSMLSQFNHEFFCCSINECSDLVSTSGSTGVTPILHPLTKTDLMRLSYNEKISLFSTGLDNKDTVLLTTALDGSFVAGLAYYLGMKRLGSTIVRTGSKNFMHQYDILRKFSISVIIGVPSNLIKLYYYCLERNLDIRELKIKKLILIGEAIRDENFNLNQLGIRLLKCYPNSGLYSTYANTETCTTFCECCQGRGGHLNSDLAYAEIVDENGCVLKSGEVGRLLLTTFGAQGMPLLRYDTGDITFIDNNICDCGRKSLRLGPILGRKNNILKINGVTFNIARLEEIILANQLVDDYCILLSNNNIGIQQLNLFIHFNNTDIQQAVTNIRNNIWSIIRVSVDIEVCNSDELSKIQFSRGARKPLRFIDNTYERK